MGHVGAAQPRLEDERFLTGRGRFVDDIRLPGEAYAAFVRSPHARARIGAISTTRARAMPGVLAVLTGDDWRRDGGGDTDVLWDLASHDGTPMATAPRPVFAHDEARHVGDTVALVVAEDPHAAADAAAAVEIAWEPLSSVTDLEATVEPGAPLVHERFGSNVSYDWRLGDAGATAEAFASAAHVTALRLTNNRLAPSAIEPRAAIGAYDRGDGRYTLWSTTQNPHLVRQWLSRDTLRAPEHAIRVVAPDVGGGFGQKTYHYPEDASLPWAARIVGRPVRWTATRAETLTVDIHSPRPRDRGAHGVRRGGADRRRRGGDHRQPRRLSEPVRRVHPLALLRHHVLRPVCDPGASLPGARGLHPHHADRRLSRRRQSRDHLRHRAPDRERRARDGRRIRRRRGRGTSCPPSACPTPAPPASPTMSATSRR